MTAAFTGSNKLHYRKNPHHDGKYSYAVYGCEDNLSVKCLLGYVTTEEAKQHFIDCRYTFRVYICNSIKLMVTDAEGNIKDDFTRSGGFKEYLQFVRKVYGLESVSYELIKTEYGK